jgi:hypothetical protein
MNRRTFITNGVAAAATLLASGCERYRRVNRPDPNDWIDRNREWDWLDDDDHFPDRSSIRPEPKPSSDRKQA